jgi:ribonuclease Z
MFESNWSFDALVEKHISEVEMPATIFVRDRETHKIDKYTGPMPGSDEPLPDIKVMIRTPWPAALLESLPPTKPCPEAISYIFRPHPQRGKFNAKKMQGLNVSDKTKWALLAKGENVVNDDGETITPDQVLGPSRPVAGLAVIDLPSIEYVDALVKREEWASEKLRSDIKAVVWILGPGVAASPKLRQFIADMNHCKHVVSSVDYCCNRLAMVGAAASTLRMAQVDPDRYGVLHHDNATLPQEAFNLPSVPQPRLPEGVVAAEVGLAFDFAPTFQLRTDQVKKPHNPLKVLESTQAVILDLAKNAREEIEASRESLDAWKSGMPRPGTDITTLGTGSALPSKYRNVSATLVRVPGVGNYLLDCGENTLGQLKRVFKPTELKEVLKDLRMIWISHLHADHHLGTASLIKAWYSVVHDSVPTTEAINLNPTADDIPQRRLAVVSHMGMSSWLSEYASVEDFGFSRILPLCISENNQVFYSSNSTPSELELFAPPGQRPDDGSGKVPKAAYEALLGLSDIQAVFVAHCSGAMAVVMTFPPDPSARNMQPLKISYSGDCRPSARFASIGAGTSVLIHEATFDDELHYDAVAKKHSTTSEALQVGEWMGARGVVLTHFSQRYQKIPVLRQAEPDDEEVEEKEQDLERLKYSMGGSGAPVAEEEDTTSGVNVIGHWNNKGRAGSNSPQIVKTHARDMKVAIGFDYMRVKIGDIAVMDKFNPTLSKLLAYEEEHEADLVVDEGIVVSRKKQGSELGSPKKKAKTKRFN